MNRMRFYTTQILVLEAGEGIPAQWKLCRARSRWMQVQAAQHARPLSCGLVHLTYFNKGAYTSCRN